MASKRNALAEAKRVREARDRGAQRAEADEFEGTGKQRFKALVAMPLSLTEEGGVAPWSQYHGPKR